MKPLPAEMQKRVEEQTGDDIREVLDLLCAEAAPEAIAVRRKLHTRPELSWNERQSQAYLKRRLEELGLSPRVAAKTGLVVDVGQGEPLVVYRADMDALPLDDGKDPGEAECVSEVPGVCHACGHDLHAAVAIGLALYGVFALAEARYRRAG